jgi:hypothetical protein
VDAEQVVNYIFYLLKYDCIIKEVII